MDYHNIYNYYYKKAFTISKKIVIAEMKKAKAKKRPFTTTHNKISKRFYDYYKAKYSDRLLSDFSEAYNIFQKRYELYDGNEEQVISWVLEDEVKAVFTDDNTSNDYRAFIIDLAVESSLKEAHRHFSNYKDFYELIYDLDKYEYFYFKDFENKFYRSSIEFNEMMDIKYPYRVEERENALKLIERENPMDNQIKKSSQSITHNNDSEALEKFNPFEDDEKLLLLNIFYNNYNKLNLSMFEYMKLIKIVGTYKDESIFNSSPKKSTSYTKFNKGLRYYSSVDRQIKLLESIINKLTILELKSVLPTLKMMLMKCKKN